MSLKRLPFILLVIFLVLFIDQSLKIWVKTHMQIGEEFPILGQNWAFIHFVENEGMAFGWKIPALYGKLILSIFRLGAIVFLSYILHQLMKAEASRGLLTCFALIFAGALGNIIDSVFYGQIFSASPYHGGVAELFPEGGGYAGVLYGKVVDMFYFPMIESVWPSWMPFVGGEQFLFFRPVFNVADASISVGVILLLLFYRNFFTQESISENKENPPSAEQTPIEG
ncbi:MAG: lipoprotein signal peptidase [Saprospiraceae bacterium]|nr:lipoprotein signal peptidase [Saprospiraceae bacterium]